MKDNVSTCVICKKPITPILTWTRGHNAMPVIEGRCCSRCNDTVVIPYRLRLMLGPERAKDLLSGS